MEVRPQTLNFIRDHWDAQIEIFSEKTIRGFQFYVNKGAEKFICFRIPQYRKLEVYIINNICNKIRHDNMAEDYTGLCVALIVLEANPGQ